MALNNLLSSDDDGDVWDAKLAADFADLSPDGLCSEGLSEGLCSEGLSEGLRSEGLSEGLCSEGLCSEGLSEGLCSEGLSEGLRSETSGLSATADDSARSLDRTILSLDDTFSPDNIFSPDGDFLPDDIVSILFA
jgi:hypothetical protein